jgi:hypothetical protein
MAEVSQRLEEQLGPDEEVEVAATTASKLLHGVHRATPEHRARREASVEVVLAAFPALCLGRVGWAPRRVIGKDPLASSPRILPVISHARNISILSYGISGITSVCLALEGGPRGRACHRSAGTCPRQGTASGQPPDIRNQQRLKRSY